MASPFSLVLGIFLALPALWLPSPGILHPLGSLHGTCSSVNESSPTSLYAALTVADNSANSSSSSPWWTACTTSTPSSALPDKALVVSSSSYLSVMLDMQHLNATSMDYIWIPPWPFWHHCGRVGRRPCTNFFCELITGLLLNPEWLSWPSMLAMAACMITILRPSVIALLTRLVLTTVAYVATKYVQVIVRTILFTGSIVIFIIGTVGYCITRTAAAVSHRFILAAWSPITTTALLSCRVILLAHYLLQRIALLLIAWHYTIIMIPLEATTKHVHHAYKSAPRIYITAIRHVLGTSASAIAILDNEPKRPSKRRQSMRARYLAMRIVVDDYSSAATFLYVLSVTLLNGALSDALHATCRLHHQAMDTILLAKPLRYIENLAVAASCHLQQHRSKSGVSATLRHMIQIASPVLFITCATFIDITTAGSSDDDKRGPPKFSGEKTTFVGWFMLMSHESRESCSLF